MKNSNDTIGNRTRALLTCSAVPQPTAPPRSPNALEKTKISCCWPDSNTGPSSLWPTTDYAIRETQRLVIVLKSSRLWSIPRARSIHYTSSRLIYLFIYLFIHSPLYLLSEPFFILRSKSRHLKRSLRFRFYNKNLELLITSHIRATCPIHLIRTINNITRNINGESSH